MAQNFLIMPQNKRFLFSFSNQETSRYAQALCHPARLQIIELLQQHEFLIHKELTEKLPLASSTISQHLQFLAHARIVIRDEFAGVVGYRLNRIGWQDAKHCIAAYFSRVG